MDPEELQTTPERPRQEAIATITPEGDLESYSSDQEEEEDLEEVDVILHDPMDDWRAHTKKTISFLNQMDLQ